MPFRYITPFVFLMLVPLGGWLGGAWTFMAVVATPLCLIVLDAVLGEDVKGAAGRSSARWLPRLYIALQLGVTAWAAALVARPTTSLFTAAGLALSTGLTSGVFGFVAAHEMIHSRDRRERWLGLALFGAVFYMHFRISHVYGHHRRAATLEDPATARLGEGLYAFIPRSVIGQLREAWEFELQRRRRAGYRVLGLGNRMVTYIAIEVSFLLAMALASYRAFAFLIAVALVAIILLESFNYVAHYGLMRKRRPSGRWEPIAPRHSWNSGRWMNNAALFNMGRHSDHHRRTTHSYQLLDSLSASPKLPSGYAAAVLTAFLPPLWRRAMDRRAQAAMEGLLGGDQSVRAVGSSGSH